MDALSTSRALRAAPWTLLLCALAASAEAREAGDPPRPPVLVVEDLQSEDWKAARAARREAARLGARVVPKLLEARAASPARASARRPLDEVLAGIVDVLAREVARPIREPAARSIAEGSLGGVAGACDRARSDGAVPALDPSELGDIGSVTADEPVDRAAERERARRARGALALCGPAVTGPLLDVPPLRDPAVRRALKRVASEVYDRERERALAATDAAAREAFRARYRGLADLATPIVAAGVRDPKQRVRTLFRAVRDAALDTGLAGLRSPDPGVRRAAEDALFRLGPLARASLERLAAAKEGAPAHAREGARRLARRIRYGLSRELVRRLGHDLAGYAERPFRERRALVIELARLGGEHAVPALRALLREEVSDEVRSVAAIGLFRQGDPRGAEWLRLHSGGVPRVRISERELAAIHMDQGLRHLSLDRYERAIEEFEQVLELEETNEIAWYNLACTYSRWGRLDAAIEHLRKAVEHGFDDVGHMENDPDLDPIRDDARFREIISGLGAGRSDR